jgi:hypothetical protein
MTASGQNGGDDRVTAAVNVGIAPKVGAKAQTPNSRLVVGTLSAYDAVQRNSQTTRTTSCGAAKQ